MGITTSTARASTRGQTARFTQGVGRTTKCMARECTLTQTRFDGKGHSTTASSRVTSRTFCSDETGSELIVDPGGSKRLGPARWQTDGQQACIEYAQKPRGQW